MGVGGGDGDAGHAFEGPELFSVEIVGTSAAGAGDDDFGALFVFPNVGVGPVGFFLAGGSPNFLAGLFVEGEEGGFFVVVVDQIEAVFVEDG